MPMIIYSIKTKRCLNISPFLVLSMKQEVFNFTPGPLPVSRIPAAAQEMCVCVLWVCVSVVCVSGPLYLKSA